MRIQLCSATGCKRGFVIRETYDDGKSADGWTVIERTVPAPVPRGAPDFIEGKISLNEQREISYRLEVPAALKERSGYVAPPRKQRFYLCPDHPPGLRRTRHRQRRQRSARGAARLDGLLRTDDRRQRAGTAPHSRRRGAGCAVVAANAARGVGVKCP